MPENSLNTTLDAYLIQGFYTNRMASVTTAYTHNTQMPHHHLVIMQYHGLVLLCLVHNSEMLLFMKPNKTFFSYIFLFCWTCVLFLPLIVYCGGRIWGNYFIIFLPDLFNFSSSFLFCLLVSLAHYLVCFSLSFFFTSFLSVTQCQLLLLLFYSWHLFYHTTLYINIVTLSIQAFFFLSLRCRHHSLTHLVFSNSLFISSTSFFGEGMLCAPLLFKFL